jgi:hypothetical protein
MLFLTTYYEWLFVGLFLALAFGSTVFILTRARKAATERVTERVKEVERRIDEAPGKSKFAWDLARI